MSIMSPWNSYILKSDNHSVTDCLCNSLYLQLGRLFNTTVEFYYINAILS